MDPTEVAIILRAIDEASKVLDDVSDSVRKTADDIEDANDEIDDSFQRVTISAEQGREALVAIAEQQMRSTTESIHLAGELRGVAQALSVLGNMVDKFVGGPAAAVITTITSITSIVLSSGTAITKLIALVPKLSASFIAFATGPGAAIVIALGLVAGAVTALCIGDDDTTGLDDVPEITAAAGEGFGEVAASLDRVNTAGTALIKTSDGINTAFDAWGDLQRQIIDTKLTAAGLAPDLETRADAAVQVLGLLPKGIGIFFDESGDLITEGGKKLGMSLHDALSTLPPEVAEIVRAAGDEAMDLLGVDAQKIVEAGGSLTTAIGAAYDAASLEIKRKLIELQVELERAVSGGRAVMRALEIANAAPPTGPTLIPQTYGSGPQPQLTGGSQFTQGSLFDKSILGGDGASAAPQPVVAAPGGAMPMGGIFYNYGEVNVVLPNAGADALVNLADLLAGGA